MTSVIPESTTLPSTAVSGTYYPSYCTYNLQERDFLNPFANSRFNREKGVTNPMIQTGPAVNPIAQQMAMAQQAEMQRQQQFAAMRDPDSLSNHMIASAFQRKRGKLLTVNEVQKVDKQAQHIWNEKVANDQAVNGPFAGAAQMAQWLPPTLAYM
eukprot:NODE_487_length_796_cov_398.786248_g478_i0.p1 GENE.NODE_487_length_796_cov_398.786248_g478_i0~~NODE_487_length_796_cov_398.786248_g478_i0.p1  ORF type:complete len:155 (+),score=35.98 NODE_487_length_796_cov_398.786248_g478_i0:97-561(+)